MFDLAAAVIVYLCDAAFTPENSLDATASRALATHS